MKKFFVVVGFLFFVFLAGCKTFESRVHEVVHLRFQNMSDRVTTAQNTASEALTVGRAAQATANTAVETANEARHRASEAERNSIVQFSQIARLQDFQERAKRQLGGMQKQTAEVAKNLILSQITVAQDEEFFSDISPKDFAQKIKRGSILSSLEVFANTEREAKEVGEKFLSEAGKILGESIGTTANFKKDQYFGRPRAINGLPEKGISVVLKKASPKPLTKAIATP